MRPYEERLLAHARAVRARGASLPPGELPPADILDSWVRCAELGLDLAGPPRDVVVEAAELRERRDRASLVRGLAQAELETLMQQIAGSNFLLAFADHEGVILDLYTDNRFAASSSDAGILCGSHWAERVCGTNGLGTALALGRPVAVSGLEHYFAKYSSIACTASPIRDAHGTVVGVLDAASYFESRQRHTQALLHMATMHIENVLLVRQMRGALVLALHPRAEFLSTLSAGLLAFDDGGRLCAINERGRGLLAGLDATPGAAFEQLFDEPFEQVLSRLALGAPVRLRDAMGSVLVANAVAGHLGALSTSRASMAVGTGAGPRARSHRARATAPAAAPQRALAADFVAQDAAVVDAVRMVEAAVQLAVPILIQGETGTGKELLARHAHAASRREGAFVAVNCAAMPADLFEAELFGYAGGAFTGARREGGEGLIVSAHRGTLLLDEVGDLTAPLQAALLRFLDDRQVRPVGGTVSRRVDVQLLAATNINLDDAVAARRFRADLLHRLNTVGVVLPPLRERRDFAVVTRHVLQAIDASADIRDAAVEQLARHAWPGNFRELRAVLTRALLTRRMTHAGGTIELDVVDVARAGLVAPRPSVADDEPLPGPSALQRRATEAVVREFSRCGASVAQTARNLGVSRTTVYRHLREAGLRE